ncbi:transporter substrate-binding domain-containing protein, partial [bacterium]
YVKIASYICIALMIIGCSTTSSVKQEEPLVVPLRVGVTPDYPPVIFKQGDRISGIEADLAHRLGESLGRPVQFKELSWEKQIPALLAGEIDIIMSGMTITKARKVRVNFTDPYMKSGLLPMMRTEDAEKFNSYDSIKKKIVTIGVMPGTTGDVFVQKNFPDATRIAQSTPGNASDALILRRSIDIFIHDAPSIMWLVSENEANLTSSWEPLNEENLAWAVQRGDGELLMDINNLLRAWKEDGTLDNILLKWLPKKYLERFD